MPTFLFCFGYESPDEWRSNKAGGTDDESSNAVWIEADSEEAAIKTGLDFAQTWVGGLFEDSGISEFPGWRECNHAYWFEVEPLKRWSGLALESFPRIRA